VGVDGSQQHYQELLGNIYETMLADVADCWPTATQIKNHSSIRRRSLVINLNYQFKLNWREGLYTAEKINVFPRF
jgi:hypothetical protein